MSDTTTADHIAELDDILLDAEGIVEALHAGKVAHATAHAELHARNISAQIDALANSY